VAAAGAAYAQNKQADAQTAANQQQYENDMNAYRNNLANLEVQRNQQQQDATEQINMNNQAGRQATATATVAAGEAGVSGTSVDALLAELAGRAAYDNVNVEENLLRQDHAINVQRENAHNGVVSQVNSYRTPTMPDYLGSGLKIGQGAVDSYSLYQRNVRMGG
jgi:hypothetical protein